jgi:PAS domain S-box-containing protein
VAPSLLGSILETVPDAMVVIDERGIVQSFSAAAERMFGYAASEVCGSNVSILMPAPHRAHHDNYIARYLAPAPRPDGHLFRRRKSADASPVMYQDDLTSIFFVGFCASAGQFAALGLHRLDGVAGSPGAQSSPAQKAVFGSVIVSTPFEKSAAILFRSMLPGSSNDR